MHTKQDNRYYSVDFWRGVACLMVVVHHAAWYVNNDPGYHFSGPIPKMIFRIINHLDLGVVFFFVISGYCITAACDAMRSKQHRISTYFVRRIRRIYPPLYAAVLVLFVVGTLAIVLGHPQIFYEPIWSGHRPSSLTWSQWLGNLTLTEIWRYHFFGDKCWFFLGPSWTLCYEEQFYAVCGLLLFVNARRFFAGAMGLSAAVLAVVAYGAWMHPLPTRGFFFDGYWLLFAAGMLVYYRIQRATPRMARAIDAGLLACAFAAFALRLITGNAGLEEYYCGFLFALMLAQLYRWDGVMIRSRLLRPVIYCGIMCYSLYLIHWPFVKFAAHEFYVGLGLHNSWFYLGIIIPACLICSVAAGWIFHLYVERRFLNTPPVMPWKGLKSKHKEAFIAEAAAVPAQAYSNTSTTPLGGGGKTL